MVIVKIMGGLGNQMFQYAMARRLARANDAILKLDISWYENNNKRIYELDNFNISAEYATESECRQYAKGNRLTRKIYRVLANTFPTFHMPHYIIESNFRFSNLAYSLKPPVYVDGYWQSEKYFVDIKDIIYREFTLKMRVDHENEKIAERISDCDSISLHIRRGDYIEEKRNESLYANCSPDYYESALEMIAPRLKNPHLYIFTDDRKWAGENIRFNFPMTFVSNNDPTRGIMDMWLMSHCKCHIIANSTFSWWGAWLCRSNEKIVFAPSRWFLDTSMDTRDLIPEEWTILEN